jgi:hypothetical protein
MAFACTVVLSAAYAVLCACSGGSSRNAGSCECVGPVGSKPVLPLGCHGQRARACERPLRPTGAHVAAEVSAVGCADLVSRVRTSDPLPLVPPLPEVILCTRHAPMPTERRSFLIPCACCAGQGQEMAWHSVPCLCDLHLSHRVLHPRLQTRYAIRCEGRPRVGSAARGVQGAAQV